MSRDRSAVLERPRAVPVSPRPRPQRGPTWRTWLKLGILAAGVGFVLFAATFALLFVADYNMAGNGSTEPRARAAWAWERGDHLHYGVHLVLGRVFDLCPCSRNAAGARYYYAKFHAITPRQRAVVTNIKPSNVGEWAAYVSGPTLVWLDWIGDGIAFIGGQRPASQVSILIDSGGVTPEEMRIARGTTVVWRNVDDSGEAHSVTAGPGTFPNFDSGFLAPGEQFTFLFTERGRYVFFCKEHGEPIPAGIAGTVIVE